MLGLLFFPFYPPKKLLLWHTRSKVKIISSRFLPYFTFPPIATMCHMHVHKKQIVVHLWPSAVKSSSIVGDRLPPSIYSQDFFGGGREVPQKRKEKEERLPGMGKVKEKEGLFLRGSSGSTKQKKKHRWPGQMSQLISPCRLINREKKTFQYLFFVAF